MREILDVCFSCAVFIVLRFARLQAMAPSENVLQRAQPFRLLRLKRLYSPMCHCLWELSRELFERT